ncbi:citrate synthase/methylcitrate synthase [Leptospira gomenensis]|uniref:Citrate synthase n=1 Tax=Leptospira gomenensis TaxID=2484974 RepID=A0A5F1YFE4_9LEPT|nr:citrate synthase/methylcitrate synthase [Leptospira gomenensis]TGK37433.1 citrate synthase/methylcitrate synthase [Leptospira gomenensis]TGK40792.1 citrate synthase/methylcitrate synthase [Leptospira gomenensis]TGK43018.1 citrate synthase/methylcitrate synthase [Leptospira gomenensis]
METINRLLEEKKYSPGLEGIPAVKTRISKVDGSGGRLIVAGYPVEEFADKTDFEQTFYLLLEDKLPESGETKRIRENLVAARRFSETQRSILENAVSQGASLIECLRIGAASLSLGKPFASSLEESYAVVASLPLILAWVYRLRLGKKPILPDRNLKQAENFLYMLGISPDPQKTKALNTYWNTVADHGLNASTFTARVIVSTQSDLISAATGAIGALKGPLHGGAPGPALDTVFAIGKKENAEIYLRNLLEAGQRLMGFGHRIYKVRDPRADVLAKAARKLYQRPELREFYELAMYVESVALRLLKEYKPNRVLQTNVEFYTALLLHGLELPTELFTPVFALGRAAGWMAHCLEQKKERILRPDAIYIGNEERHWN